MLVVPKLRKDLCLVVYFRVLLAPPDPLDSLVALELRYYNKMPVKTLHFYSALSLIYFVLSSV